MKGIHLKCKVQARIPSEFGAHRLLLYRNSNLTTINTDSGNDSTTLNGSPSSIDTIPAIESEEDDSFCLVFGNFQSKSLIEDFGNSNEQERTVRGLNLTIQNTDTQNKTPLVRIHSCCFTGETLGSTRCDCAEQLHQSMHLISQNPNGGIIIYLKQEGRGIGLLDKLLCYNLIDNGFNTLTANNFLGHEGDLRTYERACEILQDLGIDRVRILTNNPDKINQLEQCGIKVEERVEMRPKTWSVGDDEQSKIQVMDRDYYLKTKVEKMGHLLEIPSTFKSLSNKN